MVYVKALEEAAENCMVNELYHIQFLWVANV